MGLLQYSAPIVQPPAAGSNIGINGQWFANDSVWNTPIPPGAFSSPMSNSAAVIAAYQAYGGSINTAFNPTKNTFTTGGPIIAPSGQGTIRWSFQYAGAGEWSFTACPASGAVGANILGDYNTFASISDTDRHIALFSTDQQVFYSLYPDQAGTTSASQNTSTGVFTTAANNNFSSGNQVQILTGPAPGGFSLGTTYYVLATNLSSTTCELSATFGGSVIVPTSSSPCTLGNPTGGDGPVPLVTAAVLPIAGSGWWNNYPLGGQLSAGPATGAANSGGVIRPSEWNNGYIPHALAGAYANSLLGSNPNSPDSTQAYIFPARASDVGVGGAAFLPEGARLQLDPSLSDAYLTGTLGVASAMLPVCHAMQTYGWYCIDQAGNFPTQIKFFSNLGGTDQYPTTAALPMALMNHMAWIPGPYLVGSSGLGPGVSILGTGGQFGYTTNYSSADGLVHVGDVMSVYATYNYGGTPGTGSITGWSTDPGKGTSYKVSAATSSTFTLTNLDGSAIVTSTGASGTLNAYFTTTAPLENIYSAQASGLLASGP